LAFALGPSKEHQISLLYLSMQWPSLQLTDTVWDRDVTVARVDTSYETGTIRRRLSWKGRNKRQTLFRVFTDSTVSTLTNQKHGLCQKKWRTDGSHWMEIYIKGIHMLQEQNPCIKLNLHEPAGTWRAGRPAIRWVTSAEEYLKKMGIMNCRQNSRDRDQWTAVVKETKAHDGL
jgi:hypothetical protein